MYADRAEIASSIAQNAAELALDYFRRGRSLKIEAKGHQDFVTVADRAVEAVIRARLEAAFPDDAIIGEEDAPRPGRSGFTWVIDPIDGTANFISDLPQWCVVIAGIAGGRTEIGLIVDPNRKETFTARRGDGAYLNGRRMQVRQHADLTSGTTAIGSSGRTTPDQIMELIGALLQSGGTFQRIGSGALSLAHTAAGRYLGYVEGHMNAWDCLAGELLVQEAGGQVDHRDADRTLSHGGRVVVGAPRVFSDLLAIADRTFQTRVLSKPA